MVQREKKKIQKSKKKEKKIFFSGEITGMCDFAKNYIQKVFYTLWRITII